MLVVFSLLFHDLLDAHALMLFTREILMIGAGVCIFVIDEHICSDGLKNFTHVLN